MAKDLPGIEGPKTSDRLAITEVVSELATLLQIKAEGTSLESRPAEEFGKVAEEI